ncbi:MAG: hypothetical protein IJR49_01380, partial [Treponema sp.]|nr:hypothetical protein [Treponema sp.]
GIRFSWKGEKDAYAYRICISKNADLRNPIVNEVLKNTFFTADANLQSGKYYWAVWQQDERGVESERSALYSFIADEIAIEQRTVFPSDNYTVWEDLIQEIKFSWKTNVPTVHTLQISKDESFSNITFEKRIDTTSYSGLPLASGTYWWRVKASNENVEYATKAKKLNVVSSFPKVDFVSPLSENPTVVKTKNPYTFRWKEISGADYYNIAIYDQNGQDSLFMGTGLSSPEFAVNFQNTELGEYRVIVQSYARETTSSTRLQGLHSSLSFRLVNPQVERPKAEPLPLFASPLNLQTDEKVYNADSLRQKPSITFSWNAVSGANAYVLSIRNAQGGQVFTRTTSATSYELKDLTVLSKGKFTWTVKAVTRRAGSITRNGREARSDFSVDFTLTGTQLIDTGKLYGQ